MRNVKQILLVSAMLSLSACSTRPLMPQTDIPKVPPAACLAECQPVPKPENGSDFALRIWEYELIDVAGACLRLHRECVEWHRK